MHDYEGPLRTEHYSYYLGHRRYFFLFPLLLSKGLWPFCTTRPLTNIVCVLPDDVRLQKVISQHKSTFLHGVKQHGGCAELIACSQVSPRVQGLWLKEVVNCLDHCLQEDEHNDRGLR